MAVLFLLLGASGATPEPSGPKLPGTWTADGALHG